MESSSGPSAKVVIPRLRWSDQQTTPPKPPPIRSEIVNKAHTRCRKHKTKYTGTTPRCINCEKQGFYDEARRDRLREALQKNQTLTTLLRAISVNLETSRKIIVDTLEDFEDGTPLTPAMPTKSIGNRLRQASPFDEHDDNSPNSREALVAASVDSIEELDFLEEDQLQNEDASGTDYMGRDSQVQRLRSLQGKLRQPEEERYVSWRQLMIVKEDDFDRLGFKLGHRRKLQRVIATMDGYPQSEPLPSYGVRTAQVNSTLARDMPPFSGRHMSRSVFPMTKESKQPQKYLHSDAHGPKSDITWTLNNPSSPQDAMHSKLLQPSIKEGHPAESSEPIKNLSPVGCALRRKRRRSG